ncbi:MAG: DNA gyrase C-terminal beta-propeller domain-containing protein [Anaerolineales bacterium]
MPEETCVITATKLGMIKKSLITELPGPSSQTFALVKVNEGDRVIEVALTDNKSKDILLATASGMAIRFKEEDVRPMGLVAAGVNGMKLDDKDEVVGMEILPTDGEILIVTSDGKAKRMDQKEFPVQGRYGKGVIAWDISGKVKLAGIVVDKPNHMATIHQSKGAPKSTRLDAITMRKRAATKGDLIVEVKPGEEVTSVSVGWTVEKYVVAENGKKNGSVGGKKKVESGKKAAPAKKAEPSRKAQGASGKKKAAPTKAKKPAAKRQRRAKKAPSPKKKKK